MMGIPVECLCRHVNDAPEGRAGLSVLCEQCGRTLLVPVPPGMDKVALEAARQLDHAPRERGSLATSLKVAITSNIASHKARDVAIVLGLVVVGVLMWGFFRMRALAQKEHFRLEDYATQDINRPEADLPLYPRDDRATAKADKKTEPARSSPTKASPTTRSRPTAQQLLRKAEAMIYDPRRTAAAKPLLKEIIRRFPNTAEAWRAKSYLTKLKTQEKQP